MVPFEPDAGRPLPTAREINPLGDLDGTEAERDFLGKTFAEARALFASHHFYPWEDLMWMGPVAFCYYVRPALDYLISAESSEDSEAIHSFLMAVNFQDLETIRPVFPFLQRGIEEILRDIARFDDMPRSDGDLEGKLRSLLQKLEDI